MTDRSELTKALTELELSKAVAQLNWALEQAHEQVLRVQLVAWTDPDGLQRATAERR